MRKLIRNSALAAGVLFLIAGAGLTAMQADPEFPPRPPSLEQVGRRFMTVDPTFAVEFANSCIETDRVLRELQVQQRQLLESWNRMDPGQRIILTLRGRNPRHGWRGRMMRHTEEQMRRTDHFDHADCAVAIGYKAAMERRKTP